MVFKWKNTVGLKQKHKKQPFSDASASHLSLVLWHVWFQAGAWISHTTSPTPPSYEVGGIAKKIKTTRLRRKTNLQKSDYPKTQIKRYSNSFCIVVGFISHRFYRFSFDSVKSHRVWVLLVGMRYFASALNDCISMCYYNFWRTWFITSLPYQSLLFLIN